MQIIFQISCLHPLLNLTVLYLAARGLRLGCCYHIWARRSLSVTLSQSFSKNGLEILSGNQMP